VEDLSLNAIAATTGMNMTTTGVLFINIETANAIMKTTSRVKRGDLSKDLLIVLIGPSSAPVWNMPCPMTKRAMIAIKAGAENPDKISAFPKEGVVFGIGRAKNKSSAVITENTSVQKASVKFIWFEFISHF